MSRLTEILIVEDNPAEMRIMQEALQDARLPNRLHGAHDGVEAMAFLHREGQFKDAKRPDLILLDLKMPNKGGLEVLAEIKSDPDLRSIPTVILSSSTMPSDVARAYDLQANGFVVKPTDLDELIAIVGGLEAYWADTVKLPASSSP